MKKILFTICLLTFIMQVPLSAHLIYENFDGFNCCYPWTFSDCTDGDATAFVGITDEASINQSYNNSDGNFLSAYNTAGAGCTDACGNVVAEMLGVDTWGAIGITICFEIAESDAADGAEDWGPQTSVIVAGSIDGGPEHSLMFSSGGQLNSEPGLDSDCDGVADGAMIPFSAITSTFTTYCFDIPYDGAEIDVRVSFNGLDTPDRDIAIDNVELFYAQQASGAIDNDYPSVPSTPACTSVTLPACPTCDDGIQNGSELGVDCGGTDCPACQAACRSGASFVDPNQALIASQFGAFIEDELIQNFIDVEKIYIRHSKEINDILSSNKTKYETVNKHFDQLQSVVMTLMLETFASGNQVTVSAKHLAILDAFLASLSAATGKHELRGEIANIRQFTPAMESLELRDALIAFDRASGADMVIAPTLVQDRMSVYYEPAQAENAQFSIIDINGKALRTYTRNNADARELHLNVEELPMGFYFLKMTSGDTVVTKKFVKQ